MSSIQTPCKFCAFAEFDPNFSDGTKSQSGCKVNRLETYRDKGLVEEVYDDEAEFFLVKTACMGYRKQEWMDAYKDNWAEQFQKESRVKADLVIPVSPKDSLYDIKKTLLSCQGQFEKVVVVNLDGKNQTYHHELSKMVREECLKPFTIETCVEAKSVEEGIDLALSFRRIISPYYLVVMPGSSVRTDYIDKVNSLVNKNLEEFLVIQNSDNSLDGNLFSKIAHTKLGGNYNIPLVEKVEELCKEQGQNYVVKMAHIVTL